jgi:hypothetical protein
MIVVAAGSSMMLPPNVDVPWVPAADALTMALADPQPPLANPLFAYVIASRNVQTSGMFLPPESDVTKIVTAAAGAQAVIAAAVSKQAKGRFMGDPLDD